MNALAVLIALLTIGVAGFGLGSRLLGRREPVSIVEIVPVAWLLGSAFVSLALASLGVFISGLVLLCAVTIACLVLGGIGVTAWRKGAFRISVPRPEGAVEWLLCLITLAGFAAVIVTQVRQSLGWDGLLVWEIKARYAFLNGGVSPHLYFSDDSRIWSHPEYPLLYPLTETWMYLWMGDCDQSWVRVIFPIFYASGVLMLCTGAARLSGKRWAGLLAAAALFFLPGQWNFTRGFVDFPLAVFYLAAVIYLLEYLRGSGRASSVTVFAIFAGLLPWVKREGIILWLCLMAIAATAFLWRREYRLALLAPLPGLAVAAGWKIAMTVLKTPPSADFLPFSFSTVGTNLGRMGPLLRTLLVDLSQTSMWSLLWYAFVIALACLLWNQSTRKTALLLLFCVALPLALDTCVYVLSAWPSYADHVQTSLPRLIMEVSLAALLAVVLAAAAGET